jgi:putative Mg2+ transporter-C (MgtC) family protein
MLDGFTLSGSIWGDLGKVGLSYLLTAVIGWNREREEHTTGLRTFSIVGMASCGYLLIFGPQAHSDDQSRVLQGLIAGIGFVGGGAILKEGANVKSTATAASIWNAGAIGASVGMERYGIALALAVLNLFTLIALLPIKNRLDRKTSDEDDVIADR